MCARHRATSSPGPSCSAGSAVRVLDILVNETRVAAERPQTPTKVSIMTRHFLSALVTVKDGERALLTRNGRLERVLEPGRHRLFDPRNELTAEVFSVVKT